MSLAMRRITSLSPSGSLVGAGHSIAEISLRRNGHQPLFVDMTY